MLMWDWYAIYVVHKHKSLSIWDMCISWLSIWEFEIDVLWVLYLKASHHMCFVYLIWYNLIMKGNWDYLCYILLIFPCYMCIWIENDFELKSFQIWMHYKFGLSPICDQNLSICCLNSVKWFSYYPNMFRQLWGWLFDFKLAYTYDFSKFGLSCSMFGLKLFKSKLSQNRLYLRGSLISLLNIFKTSLGNVSND